jgi:hypothetical protein
MSTDKQSADSPADQVARCREFAFLDALAEAVARSVLADLSLPRDGAAPRRRPR